MNTDIRRILATIDDIEASTGVSLDDLFPVVRALKALRLENQRLRDIVGCTSSLATLLAKLPRTADGIHVVPGVDYVWAIEPSIGRRCTITTDPMCGWKVRDVSQEYSTVEAAAAEYERRHGSLETRP